jgi:hypothetical protein
VNSKSNAIRGGLLALLLLGPLAGWNGVTATQNAASKERSLTTVEVGSTAVPGLGALLGGITSLSAWLSARGAKVEKITETMKLLQAVATLIDNLQGPLQQASEQFKKNGFPPSGKIELQWTGTPPIVVQWGPVAPATK